MTRRSAEIAGRLGWTVRSHERNPKLRLFGVGIWLWESGLRTLEHLDAFDQATERARVLKEWRIADQHGRPLMSRYTSATDRLLLPPRADLYAALIARAEYYGEDIRTSSVVTSISPGGTMDFADGHSSKSDVVVAAEGSYSRLRESIFCTSWMDFGGQAGIRMLIDRQEDYPDDTIVEYWHGARRLLYNPCTEGQDYIFLSAPVGDERASRQPVDRDLWSTEFPAVAELVYRLSEDGRWDRLVNVRCRSWSVGRAAVIGDAAHAMPPNLGQAANSAFINAMAIAAMAETTTDIEAMLPRWDKQQRPITNHVQQWSYLYGFVLGNCPHPLMPLRAQAIKQVSRSSWFDRNLNLGARFQPMAAPAGTANPAGP